MKTEKIQAEFPDLPASEPSKKPAGVGKARLRRPERRQRFWLETDLESLIPADHPVRVVWAFVEGLDLKRFTEPLRSVEGHAGRSAADPAVLIGLWLYALSEGVGSARQLARLCKEHHAYRWLCGGVSVNHHTLSDFRWRYAELDDLFTGSLAVLMEEGLLNLERVAQDGMRVRASAGAASFRREAGLDAQLAEAKAQVERLKEKAESADDERTAGQRGAQERAARERQARIERARELLPQAKETLAKQRDKKPEEARISTTDPEARVMKMPDGGYRPAYNVELAATSGALLVVGVEVTNIGSDMGQLPPMLDQIEKRTGTLPKEALVDGGFPSSESIEDAARRGVVVYAPVQKPKDDDRDRFLPLPGDSGARAAWRRRMGTDEAKEIYKQRGAIAECVNASFRRRGMLFYLVRGLAKARSVAILIALCHNLFRAYTLRRESAPLAA